MYDFISIGEMLIDFTMVKSVESTGVLFEQNPGGAPANVACALSKLHRKTSFIGKVGNDQFGKFCKEALESCNVDSSNLVLSDMYATTLAFVHLSTKGDRSFSFYRKNLADVNLNPSDVNLDLLKQTKIFHFGSVSMTDEPSRTTTLECVKQAKKNGAIISYDPNLRTSLWESIDTAKKIIMDALPLADILKISEDEAEILFGERDCEKVAYKLSEKYNIPIVLVSKAQYGCVAVINSKTYTANAYDVATIDTTGSGDCFLAGFLHKLLDYNVDISNLKDEQINYMLEYANAVGSLATTKKGAIPAIPSPEEIIWCMKNCSKLIL